MMRKFLSIFLLCFHFFLLEASKLPEITVKDVKAKVEEILGAHASYKELNSVLAGRILSNFLDELDPTKTYFVESEIKNVTEASDEMRAEVLKAFSEADFTLFEEIYQKMHRAIERRRTFKEELDKTELPKGVKIDEFKDMKWASNVEALKERWLRMRSLQSSAAEKLDNDVRELSLQRIEKRRRNIEDDLLENDPVERERRVLSLVLKATASSLDTHTAYFTPGEATQFMINVQQRLFGIGAQLRDDVNGFTVVKIIDGGPAFRGKQLKAKDKIIAVDGEPVVGMEISDAVELIRGDEGTEVLLTVLREVEDKETATKKDERLDLRIVRGEVVLEDSRVSSTVEPFGDGVIAHIKLFSFYQDSQSSSASDLLEEINRLSAEHKLKGVLLDLRYNSGGIMSQAVEVTGLFISKGIVVSTKASSNYVQHHRDVDGKLGWDGPLLVLTNRASASAAEIVSQTLQDYGRALVIGDDHTFGKGTFQTFTLDASQKGGADLQGEYKVTKGRYYTVSGKSPQLTGVIADIQVPGVLSEMEIGEKFSKYPLENDKIEENFDDSLDDVPQIHRQQLARLYKHGLQERSDRYTKYTEQLAKNSATRIKENQNYQNFLTELRKKDGDVEEEPEEFGLNDLQLSEAFNIMKDLILLDQLNTLVTRG